MDFKINSSTGQNQAIVPTFSDCTSDVDDCYLKNQAYKYYFQQRPINEAVNVSQELRQQKRFIVSYASDNFNCENSFKALKMLPDQELDTNNINNKQSSRKITFINEHPDQELDTNNINNKQSSRKITFINEHPEIQIKQIKKRFLNGKIKSEPLENNTNNLIFVDEFWESQITNLSVKKFVSGNERNSKIAQQEDRPIKEPIQQLIYKEDSTTNQQSTFLIETVQEEVLSTKKHFLKKEVDINSLSKYAYTGLHAAVLCGNIEAIKMFLDHGVNIETIDEYGKTVLHYAMLEERTEIIEMLLNKGANIEARDKFCRTALHIASYYNNIKNIKVLLDKGANIEAREVQNKTALCLATEQEWIQSVQILLSYGADIEAKDQFGRTALHLASYRGYHKTVETLLKYRAGMHAKDMSGNTPLDLAWKAVLIELNKQS
jgi:ankyrin repeat protein